MCVSIFFLRKHIIDHLKDLATPSQTHQLYLTLLTLLFAYAYESRTTQLDPTPESGWTVSSLVPAFSALDTPPYSPTPQLSPESFDASELATTFTASYRRSLAFPLFRSWALAERCRADAAAFLRGGKRMVVRCLLELKDILDHHEVYYVYSKIWVDDFCVWIQLAGCVIASSWPSASVLKFCISAGTRCYCSWRIPCHH